MWTSCIGSRSGQQRVGTLYPHLGRLAGNTLSPVAGLCSQDPCVLFLCLTRAHSPCLQACSGYPDPAKLYFLEFRSTRMPWWQIHPSHFPGGLRGSHQIAHTECQRR